MVMKWFKNFKHCRLVFFIRCFIFGCTKTKIKDIKRMTKLNFQFRQLKEELIYLSLDKKHDNKTRISEIKNEIQAIKTEITAIRKNMPKYVVKYITDNIQCVFIHESVLDLNINSDYDDINSPEFSDLKNEVELEIFFKSTEYSDLKVYRQN